MADGSQDASASGGVPGDAGVQPVWYVQSFQIREGACSSCGVRGIVGKVDVDMWFCHECVTDLIIAVKVVSLVTGVDL